MVENDIIFIHCNIKSHLPLNIDINIPEKRNVLLFKTVMDIKQKLISRGSLNNALTIKTHKHSS